MDGAGVRWVAGCRPEPVAFPWYKSAVFYEVWVRSFRDSNGDGIGDLRGLTQSLDYLQWLGVDCLWLPPTFSSPLRDGGYDVSDYYTLHPAVGTLDDMANLLNEAHRRGMRVLNDLPVNHTSNEHSWFQEARQPGSPRRDWYVWSDRDARYREARIIFNDHEKSNWAWDPVAQAFYWHRFYHSQPDLNYENPEVRRAMLDVIRFWLSLGFDGLRLDAVPYIWERENTNCENLPETHAFLKEIRAMVDAEFGGDRVLFAEANQWPQDAVAYMGDGDECHMNFHFPLMTRLFMALARQRIDDLVAVLRDTPDVPDGCQWGVFLRNHDELTLEMVTEEDRAFMWAHYAPDPRQRSNLGIRRRLAPLLNDDRQAIELLHGLLFSLPGSPVLYYGDEIGMGDDVGLPDRDGLRTPMQWEPMPGGGVSTAGPGQAAPPANIDPRFGPEARNVVDQRTVPGSLLNWIRGMLETRRRHPEMGLGSFALLDSGDPAVLAFLRRYQEKATVVFANFAQGPRSVRLDRDHVGSRATVDAVTGERLADLHPDSLELELRPLEFRWLELR